MLYEITITSSTITPASTVSTDIFKKMLSIHAHLVIEVICGVKRYQDVRRSPRILRGFLLPFVFVLGDEKSFVMLKTFYGTVPHWQELIYRNVEKKVTPKNIKYQKLLSDLGKIYKPISPNHSELQCENCAQFVDYLKQKVNLENNHVDGHYNFIWRRKIANLRFVDIDTGLSQGRFTAVNKRRFWRIGLQTCHPKTGTKLFLFLTNNYDFVCHEYLKEKTQKINLYDRSVRKWIQQNDFAAYTRLYA